MRERLRVFLANFGLAGSTRLPASFTATDHCFGYNLMRRALIGLLLVNLGCVCGCGGRPTESSLAAAPHGGNIVQVPDSNVVVELKTDTVAPAKGTRREPGKSRILAYFYDSVSATTLNPAPSEVKISLGAAANGTNVNLAPQSGDPGQFASEPGDYPDSLRGQISFQNDGKALEAKFSFR
jgi:hypothetical protein